MCCIPGTLGLLNRQLLACILSREISKITRLHKRSTFAIYTRFCLFNKQSGGVSTSKQNKEQLSNITSMAEQHNKIFTGIRDRYEGLTIDSKSEQCEAAVFAGRLDYSLKQWAENNVRTVWFRVALEHSDWVPILAKNGFLFHRVQGEYVVMYRWLSTTEESNIPCFAHTMVGVGAVVVNSSGDILVVREKYAVKGFPFWKLPGGYIDPGEDIDEAARREVLEETGIDTKFNFVVSFRHTHGVNFDCSDVYFIVSLTPLTGEIKICNREIEECQWMKISEYMEHPKVHEGNKFFLQKYLDYKTSGKAIGSFKGTHPILKKPYTIFSIEDLKTKEDNVATKSNI